VELPCDVDSRDQERSVPLVDDAGPQSSRQGTTAPPNRPIQEDALDIACQTRARRQRPCNFDVVNDTPQLLRRRIEADQANSEAGAAECAKDAADVRDGAADGTSGITDPDREDGRIDVTRPGPLAPLMSEGQEEPRRFGARRCKTGRDGTRNPR
jgi:hypothetical protein